MCEFIKDTDCRIIRRNFTLGFCMRSIKFTKLYARMVEDATCHTSTMYNQEHTGARCKSIVMERVWCVVFAVL